MTELIVPEQLKRPLSAHRSRPAEVKVTGAIVHSMGERIRFEGELLEAPVLLERQRLSVQALISQAGEIVSCCGVDRIAYHAGISEWEGERDLNRTFLGAEWLVAGDHDYPSFLKAITLPGCYSEAQYRAGGWLYASWALAFGFGFDRILAHSQVSSDAVKGEGKGKRDPGPGFDWFAFRAWFDRWRDELRGAA